MVSVVIPVYNKQIYLNDCLNSIICQTWKDLEIIAVDDGSTDRSWGILRDFAEIEPRIKLLQIPHSGPSMARNTGMENAAGEFITFVDADDYVEPTYIENLVQNIGDADLCVSGYKRWDQRKDLWEDQKCCSAILNKEEIFLWHKSFKMMYGIGWKLYRRTFLTDYHLVFPDQINQGEDRLFIDCILLHLNKVVFIKNIEYIVRKHDLFSLTHQKFNEMQLEKRLDAYQRLQDRIKHPVLMRHYKCEQINVLGIIGKIICYQDNDMHTRKRQFFGIVKKHRINIDSFLGLPETRTAAITRFSLMSRTFLPFYCLSKIWYHSKEERQLYGAPPKHMEGGF